jgi:hypothetical protein
MIIAVESFSKLRRIDVRILRTVHNGTNDLMDLANPSRIRTGPSLACCTKGWECLFSERLEGTSSDLWSGDGRPAQGPSNAAASCVSQCIDRAQRSSAECVGDHDLLLEHACD